MRKPRWLMARRGFRSYSRGCCRWLLRAWRRLPSVRATEVDLFFPVPVQGKLAVEMQRLIQKFDDEHPDIHVTAVYTGSYDDTNVKTHAAIQAGKPPGAVIMSANFVREYVINDEVDSFDGLIAHDGQTQAQFMADFCPPLRANTAPNAH